MFKVDDICLEDAIINGYSRVVTALLDLDVLSTPALLAQSPKSENDRPKRISEGGYNLVTDSGFSYPSEADDFDDEPYIDFDTHVHRRAVIPTRRIVMQMLGRYGTPRLLARIIGREQQNYYDVCGAQFMAAACGNVEVLRLLRDKYHKLPDYSTMGYARDLATFQWLLTSRDKWYESAYEEEDVVNILVRRGASDVLEAYRHWWERSRSGNKILFDIVSACCRHNRGKMLGFYIRLLTMRDEHFSLTVILIRDAFVTPGESLSYLWENFHDDMVRLLPELMEYTCDNMFFKGAVWLAQHGCEIPSERMQQCEEWHEEYEGAHEDYTLPVVELRKLYDKQVSRR